MLKEPLFLMVDKVVQKMSQNEELIQRGYIQNGLIVGDKYGQYAFLDLGSTTIKSLHGIGLLSGIPDRDEIRFPFTSSYKLPKPISCKPDRVFYQEVDGQYQVVATGEFKQPTELNTEKKKLKARDQALYAACVTGAYLAIVTDGTEYEYIDVHSSLKSKEYKFIEEHRSLTPGILLELLDSGKQTTQDLSILAEKCWQTIWHATKEEPKECLMTFVELFVLKFLSDNFSKLGDAYTFYELSSRSESQFRQKYGKTQIEYYVQNVRPRIKEIFSEKMTVSSEVSKDLIGIETLISNTSVINGFAFLKSGQTSIQTFNRTFIDLLSYFNDFGSLTNIDPEFKLRLYETFLKKSARQQKLGQFFTPRNVVKSIIKMAQLSSLKPDSLVLDPAAGVGGFVLEPLIDKASLPNNIELKSGKYKQKVRLLGLDVDERTNILAKANTLIHLAEQVKSRSVHPQSLNQLMADMFLVLNENHHLGSLNHPITEKADVILTNPPYVTRGSAIYKDEIENSSGLPNGFSLKNFYSRCGLGLEGLFLRYISGALKPGGRAFVIVPQGMLTRTESTLKETILAECNLTASISLPPNTFFNTPQKTYILGLEKRFTLDDDRPEVFCAIASSIGESLDERRVPDPKDNTLSVIADCFVQYQAQPSQMAKEPRVKIVGSSNFKKEDRWDVSRFWTDEELVNLGAREPAIGRTSFLDQSEKEIIEALEDLRAVKDEIALLTECDMKVISVSNPEFFSTRKGTRVTRNDGDLHSGPIPVYSGKKNPKEPLTRISRDWAYGEGIAVESADRPIITVNANGSVGEVFLRAEECVIHDDVKVIEVKAENIDLNYLVFALRDAIQEGNYEYEAKLYNVGELAAKIPVGEKGDFDKEKQRSIASALKKFDTLKQRLYEIGSWANESRVQGTN